MRGKASTLLNRIQRGHPTRLVAAACDKIQVHGGKDRDVKIPKANGRKPARRS
jgi:hypothetical protein